MDGKLALTLANGDTRRADAAILALPFYNYGVSQHVKTWIDLAMAGGENGEKFLDGKPAAGDTFTLQPAPNQDVFATLQALADALSVPGNTLSEAARRTNAFGSAIADIATAQDHMLALRSDVGGRLAKIDTANDDRGLQEVSLAESLSTLRDTDYAEAISRLNLQMVALEAAQKTILQAQGMSLFSKL